MTGSETLVDPRTLDAVAASPDKALVTVVPSARLHQHGRVRPADDHASNASRVPVKARRTLPRIAAREGYGSFCPIAKAAEILAERWTLLVLRDLLVGSRHFNELRRGVPVMSPALQSSRLLKLE